MRPQPERLPRPARASAIVGMYDKSVLTKYKAQDATAGTVAWNAYVAGDWTAGNTARRLATGKDDLILDITKSAAYQNASDEERAKILADAKAVTESNGSGGRSIFMIDQSGKFEGDGAYWNMAVTLQHEAYRDGIKSWDNKAETYQVVLAHTLMASKLAAKDTSFLDQQLNMDLLAFSLGGSVFSKYVDGIYDSSEDFWKLVEVKGRLVIENDGQKDIVDSEGNVIKSHNKALLDKINFLKMLQGRGIAVSEELQVAETEYGESNTIDPKDTQQVKELTAMLVGMPVGDTGFARNINNALEKLLSDKGYTRKAADGYQFMKGKDVGIDVGVQLDITDMFFQFSGLDQKSILGSQSIVSDKLFATLHGSVVERAMISAMYNPGDYWPDRDSFSMGGPGMRYLMGEIAREGARTILGSTGRDPYSNRLAGYINSRSDVVDRAYEYISTFDESNYDQKAMSKELQWGYMNQVRKGVIPEGSYSSLCYAMSLIAYHDAANMRATSWEDKRRFLASALDKQYIEVNGTVKDTLQYLQLYASGYAGGIQPLMASVDTDYGSIFDVYESNLGHKVLYKDGLMYVQPYPGLNTATHNAYHFYVGIDYRQLFLEGLRL